MSNSKAHLVFSSHQNGTKMAGVLLGLTATPAGVDRDFSHWRRQTKKDPDLLLLNRVLCDNSKVNDNFCFCQNCNRNSLVPSVLNCLQVRSSAEMEADVVVQRTSLPSFCEFFLLAVNTTQNKILIKIRFGSVIYCTIPTK